jgi:hypothetical protein
MGKGFPGNSTVTPHSYTKNIEEITAVLLPLWVLTIQRVAGKIDVCQ